MTKTIAVHLQKGGTGKTTLTGSVAYELGKIGKTIIVDLDPQGNTSSWLLKLDDQNPEPEIADYLLDKVSIDKVVSHTVSPNIDILHTFGVGGDLKTFSERVLAGSPMTIKNMVGDLKKLEYIYIIFDLSPGMGLLERSVLAVCDEVIIPMTPEYFSLDGLEIFEDEIQKLQKTMGHVPHKAAIVLNNYNDAIGQHKDIKKKWQSLRLKGFL